MMLYKKPLLSYLMLILLNDALPLNQFSLTQLKKKKLQGSELLSLARYLLIHV